MEKYFIRKPLNVKITHIATRHQNKKIEFVPPDKLNCKNLVYG